MGGLTIMHGQHGPLYYTVKISVILMVNLVFGHHIVLTAALDHDEL